METIYMTLYGTVFGGTPLKNTAVELRWQNLTVKSKRGKVRLLKDVCGKVKGRFLAVMGPSGSGKTTFLNQLSMRARGMEVEGGLLTIEGQSYGANEIKKFSGYVMQDDILFEKLTVWEVMWYAARLKMHPQSTAVQRRRRCEKILKMLGLTECKDVVVGSAMLTGISGGQRKRLAVGVELLTRPSILFLDECTSGLDSVSALELIRILRSLAHKEMVTVVTTIHQPSSSIFRLFDDLLILHSGTVLFHGPASEMVDFYARAGLPCPAQTNPADWALDAISTSEGLEKLLQCEGGDVNDEDENGPFSLKRLEFDKGFRIGDKISMHERPAVSDKNAENEKDTKEVEDVEEKNVGFNLSIRPPRINWFQQTGVLLHRSLKLAFRERQLLVIQLIQTIIMGILVGCVFLRIPLTAATFSRRSASLFFCCINQGIFGALMTINIFPAERVIIMRERLSGLYYSSAYFMAKVVTEVAINVWFPLVFSSIVYWLIGYQSAPGHFFIFLGFMELTYFSATSLAFLISGAAGTVLMSAAMLPMALEIFRLFGGFFMPPNGLPLYFSWIDAVSYIKYTYMGVMMNEFQTLQASCTNSTNGTVCVSGQIYLDSLGINYMPIYACALVVIGLILVMRFAAYLILRFRV